MRTLSLLSSTVMSAAVLTACDGGVTEPPFLPDTSPTPTDEATAAVEPTPTTIPADLESFRAFAPQIEAAVEAGDVDFFMDIVQTSTFVCGGLQPPRCEGVDAGVAIEGVWIGFWRSEGLLPTVDDFRASLREYLDSLAQPTLYAIAALDHYVGGTIGGPAVFAVVASSHDLPNTTRVFEFVQENGGWRMPNLISVSNFADEWLSGRCSECYDHWERWEGNP